MVGWAELGQYSVAELGELGQHGVAKLCLLATQWGSLGVAATRLKLCVVLQVALSPSAWGNG